MTFEEWWDTSKSNATPDTYRGWEESCRQAFEAGAQAERNMCATISEIMANNGHAGGWSIAVAIRARSNIEGNRPPAKTERTCTMNECEQTRAWPERTVAILNNGDTAIVVDDHCYAVRNWNGSEWGWSAWIFREALAALKELPDNPDESATVAVNAA